MADKRGKRRRREARRRARAQHHPVVQRVDVDVDAAAGRGQLTATLRAVYATKPFALVTWIRNGQDYQMAPPRYFGSREAAEAAAPTDGTVWSVVDVAVKPPPQAGPRLQLTDSQILAQRRRQAEGSAEWIAGEKSAQSRARPGGGGSPWSR